MGFSEEEKKKFLKKGKTYNLIPFKDLSRRSRQYRSYAMRAGYAHLNHKTWVYYLIMRIWVRNSENPQRWYGE